MLKNDDLLKTANQYLQNLITYNHDIFFNDLPDDILNLDKEWNIINPYYDEFFTILSD